MAQAEEARRLAGEERLRIARELHDVLARNLSLISVQAGVALHLVDERPEQTRAALTAIKEASREALGELRFVLEVLREPDAHDRSAGPERLAELIEHTRAAGVPIETHLDQLPLGLPERVTYRIVQGALTNITRPAPGADTHIRLAGSDGQLTIEVANGPAVDAAEDVAGGTGHGLRGMRERVRALGGEVEAGPQPTGGFRIRARLPLAPSR